MPERGRRSASGGGTGRQLGLFEPGVGCRGSGVERRKTGSGLRDAGGTAKDGSRVAGRGANGRRRVSSVVGGEETATDAAVLPVTADRSPRFGSTRIEKPAFQQRLIMLLDIDAFFASAEQVARPELAGKPVIVGGLVSDRSVVASASYEVRALGVKTAMPIAQAYRICPDGVFLRGNHSLYATLSKNVMEICNTFTPIVQQASIDEAYMDLAGTQRLYARGEGSGLRVQGSGEGARGEGRGARTTGDSRQRLEHPQVAQIGAEEDAALSGDPSDLPNTTLSVPSEGCACSSMDSSVPLCLRGSSTDVEPLNWPVGLAERLLRAIRRETGLGATIGIGANKLVARMAMQRAKPGGVCYIWPGYEASFLATCPLADVPGIGRRTAAMLADYNLLTAMDVQHTDRALLVATFGERFAGVLHEAAWGRGPTHLELEYEQKSVSRDTSFERDTTDMNYIRSMLYYLTERACRTLRKMHQAACTVSVKLRYSDFQTLGKSRALPAPSNHDDTVYRVAGDLLEKLYTRAIAVRLVGVHLSGLVGDDQVQLRMWEQQLRSGRLYEASDRIRDRFGFCALMKGPAIELMGRMEHDAAGLKLRTSCLTK